MQYIAIGCGVNRAVRCGMPIPQNEASIGRRLLRDDVYSRLRDAIVDEVIVDLSEPGTIDVTGGF